MKRIYRGKALKTKSILVFITFIVFNLGAQDLLRINEFMAVNQTTIADENGEYSDWIELYNPTASSINIKGWSLTDDKLVMRKWIFPNVTIASKGCLLIFASGKNRRVVGHELHTNFKLDGSGEYLALADSLGKIYSEFDPFFPEQYADISYGYYDNTYVGITEPSPGTEPSADVSKVIPAPKFNKNRGFYGSAFSLGISSEVASAKIYYTLDGSTPSKTNGTLYSSPVSISTTSIVRAVAIVDGQTPSRITTSTFLFLNDVVNQPNDPEGFPTEWGPYTAISGNAIADYEMDPEMVSDAAYAAKVKAALLDIPTMSLVSDMDNFFSFDEDEATGGIYIYTGPPISNTTYGLGKGWERPVSMEYFDTDGKHDLQVDCGIKLQGGHSRRPEKSPKHSFQLLFKDEYGPTRLKHSFYEEGSNTDHNKIILRAEFCNSWIHHSANERVLGSYQRDIWGKDTQRDMGHPSGNSVYTHLYINGVYWGIYAPTERMDSDFGEAYLGGDADDYDVIKDYTEVADGNILAWDAMMAQVNAGLVSTEAYQKIQGNNADGSRNTNYESYLDVMSLADYMLINFYGSNTDWDHHNWAAMRNRKKPGKGFKFISWDGEHLIKTVDGNELGENNPNCPSGIFQQLMENEDFKRLFADRINLHCFNGGALTPDANRARWIERRDMIDTAIYGEATRWGDYRRDVHPYQTAGPFDLYDVENYWLPQQDFMLNTYFPQRTDVFIQQLRDAGFFPNADAPSFSINGNSVVGKTIEKGDILTMSTNEGAMYYTTDGSDPVSWASSQQATQIDIISESADKRVLVPKSDQGTTWSSDVNFDDSGWQLCSGSPGGVGYEQSSGIEDYLTLNMASDMYQTGTNPNTSCYVRIVFDISSENISKIKSLILNIRFDDGFAAYLNGTLIASANISLPLTWNSNNSTNHEGDVVETYNISEHVGLLKEGENLLAIQGVNNSTTSSDFIILPSLVGSNQPAEGSISSSANFYSGAITLNTSAHIKARTIANGEWSAMTDRFFVIPSEYNNLKMTEVHYHPHDMDTIDGDKFEFLEIKNTGSSILDLGGITFDKGIDYIFESNTELKPGEFIVLAANVNYFVKRYEFYPYDDYKGQLDNDGERISIISFTGDTVSYFKYNDNQYWPQSPDGYGTSLVPTEYDPTNDQDSSIYWRHSYEVGGSPGADDIEGISYIKDSDSVRTSIEIEPVISFIDDYVLDQNYPNPFVDETYFNYKLAGDAYINLSVYNIMGQKISTLDNGYKQSGTYLIRWNPSSQLGNEIENGIYYYRLEIVNGNQNKAITKKMIKLK